MKQSMHCLIASVGWESSSLAIFYIWPGLSRHDKVWSILSQGSHWCSQRGCWLLAGGLSFLPCATEILRNAGWLYPQRAIQGRKLQCLVWPSLLCHSCILSTSFWLAHISSVQCGRGLSTAMGTWRLTHWGPRLMKIHNREGHAESRGRY